MEKRRDDIEEKSKELVKTPVEDLTELKKELQRLRELKKQKILKEKNQQNQTTLEKEKIVNSEPTPLDTFEERLNEIDDFITKSLEQMETNNYAENAKYIETELQTLEQEIIGEKGLIEEELNPYEKLLEVYPWLEQPKYEFMYSMPNVKKKPTDFESWKTEWAKVVFDYAKFAILHILHIRQLYSEKPFSNFEDRQKAIKEIAEELVAQDLAQFISKKKERLRVYWRTLDLWAQDIYDWAIEFGKLEPILIFEIREAKREFSNLPKSDLEEIFKMLSKDDKGSIIKADDGQLALKIKLE